VTTAGYSLGYWLIGCPHHAHVRNTLQRGVQPAACGARPAGAAQGAGAPAVRRSAAGACVLLCLCTHVWLHDCSVPWEEALNKQRWHPPAHTPFSGHPALRVNKACGSAWVSCAHEGAGARLSTLLSHSPLSHPGWQKQTQQHTPRPAPATSQPWPATIQRPCRPCPHPATSQPWLATPPSTLQALPTPCNKPTQLNCNNLTPLQALPEFHVRVRVLQRLGYLDSEKSVTLKGRVACEINSTQVGWRDGLCGGLVW